MFNFCKISFKRGTDREIGKTDLAIAVKFDDECLKYNPEHRLCFPYVGACEQTITFPVFHMEGFDQFKEIFLALKVS